MHLENNITNVRVTNELFELPQFDYKSTVTGFFPVNDFLSVSNKTHKRYLSMLSTFRDSVRNAHKNGCTPFIVFLANLVNDVDPQVSICDNKRMEKTYKQALKLGKMLFPSEVGLKGANVTINNYRLLVANEFSPNKNYFVDESDFIFCFSPPTSYNYKDFLDLPPQQNYVTGIPAISKALYSNVSVTQQTIRNCTTSEGKKFNADKAICFASYALSMFCIFSYKQSLVNKTIDHYNNYSISYYGTDKYIIKILKNLTSQFQNFFNKNFDDIKSSYFVSSYNKFLCTPGFCKKSSNEYWKDKFEPFLLNLKTKVLKSLKIISMDNKDQIGFSSYSCDRPIKMAHNAGTGIEGEYSVGTIYWCNNNIKKHLKTQSNKDSFTKFVLIHELTHQITQKNTTDNYYGAAKCLNSANETAPDTFDNTDCVAMVIADMIGVTTDEMQIK